MTLVHRRQFIASAVFVALASGSWVNAASKSAPSNTKTAAANTATLPGTSNKSEVRTLKFPDDKSVGALILVKPKHADAEAISSYSWGDRQVAGAKGLLHVTVPPNTLLMLDANKTIFMKPQLLEQLPASGIDMLRLSAISLDDSEDGLCDQALAHINGMKGLQALAVDRSEATDLGLSKIKDLPRLRCISTFLSGINGECFKAFSKLPNLQELSVPWCKLNLKTLAYLPQFPNLQILDLARVDLDEGAAIEIGKCLKLKDLSLRGDHRFDDKCLRHLATLKKLKYLDLGDTKVTLAGLKSISDCKLKELILDYTLRRQEKEIRATFPGCTVSFCGGDKNPTREEKQIYAPLR
jgi:hypothetical protein